MRPRSTFPRAALTALGGLVIAATPGALAAQEPHDRGLGERPAGLVTVVRDLDPGSRLRVAWDRELRAEGELVSPGPGDVLNLRGEARTVEIPYARVDSIWTGRPGTAEGAVVGGLAGAAVGALVLLGVGEALCDSPTGNCSGPTTTGWVVLVGGGATVGAGFGALVGAGQIRWTLAFPARGL